MPEITTKAAVDAPPERILFGRKFREARIALGLSQYDVHRQTGINRAFLSGVERGVQNVSLDHMARLANLVKVPLYELLTP